MFSPSKYGDDPIAFQGTLGQNSLNKQGAREMVAYEFYQRENGRDEHLIGILPERRASQERVTQESIMKWVSMVLGDNTADLNNVYFVQVEL